MGMKMVSTDDMSARSVITCIQAVNKNNTRSKFQEEHTELLEQLVINGKGKKQSQKNSNR